MIEIMWQIYIRALWSVRCYVWNPFCFYVDKAFDAADWQVRKRISKFDK